MKSVVYLQLVELAGLKEERLVMSLFIRGERPCVVNDAGLSGNYSAVSVHAVGIHTQLFFQTL
ncbi:MAG: hypothetical protein NVS2B12_21680 [Ktedonobacteraceae bacterium]